MNERNNDGDALAQRVQAALQDGVPRVLVVTALFQESVSVLYALQDWFGALGLVETASRSSMMLRLISGSHTMAVRFATLSHRRDIEIAVRGYRPTLVLDAQGQEPDQINGVPKEVWS